MDRSYTAYEMAGYTAVPNPTNAVGGSFIHGLRVAGYTAVPNPTNAVGGSFIHGLRVFISKIKEYARDIGQI